MAGKQTARAVEDYLHACRPRPSLIVRGTRSLRRARVFHPDLGHPKIRMSHVGRRTLGDDLGFVRGAAKRSACTVGWGVLGLWDSGRELGEDVEGEAAEEEEAWRADVEQELQALATAKVQEGLGADDPFHISQLHIILDSTDALLDDFASRLRDGARDPESSECAFPFMLNPHTLSSPTMSLTGTQP